MWQRIGVLTILCGIMVSCGGASTDQSPQAPTTTVAPAAAATTVPEATRIQPTASPNSDTGATPTTFMLPTSTPSNVDAIDATAIAATVEAGLPATATPDASGLLASLQGETIVVGLYSTADASYFATIASGMLENYDDPHPLIIYRKTGGTFTEVARHDFVDYEYIMGIELLPEYANNNAQFLVWGGIGAHSSFSTRFSFDGTTLSKQAEYASSAAGGATDFIDLDDDGKREIIADNTDYYVFCYACGVRLYGELIYVWDGTTFVEQRLQDSSDPKLQQAITYARAERWNKVAEALQSVGAPQNDTDKWTIIQLERLVVKRTPNDDDASLFLSNVFFGDYDAAIDLMRRHPVDELIDDQGAFFSEENMSGFSDLVSENVVRFTTTALTQDESLTSARFLRGWAQLLVDPRSPSGLADIQAVAKEDPFFTDVRNAIVGR